MERFALLTVLLAALGPAAIHLFGGPPVRLGTLQETVTREVPVSGVYLVALMGGGRPVSASTDSFHVWIPQRKASLLCVSVKSIDGAYGAKTKFNIAQTESGRYELSFGPQDQNRDRILRYAPGELVLDGRAGEDCDRPESLTHVPMSWTRQDLQSRSVQFYVNADGHQAVLRLPSRTDAEQVKSVPCAPLQSTRPQRVFSALCSLEIASDLDQDSGWLELRRFGRMVAKERLGFSVPPR